VNAARDAALRAAFEGAAHVCFDKDGTLTDVHAYWAHTCRLRAERLAARSPGSSSEALLAAMGIDPRTGRILPGGPVGLKPRPEVVRAAARAAGAGDEAEADAVFREVDAEQQASGSYRIVELPGAARALDVLAGRGLALSVFSSDRRENTERVLAALGWTGRFKAVVGGGCVKRGKPAPEGFLEACRRVGAPPEASLYVGDTVEDLVMAEAGGARAWVGVASGLATPEELSRRTPLVVGSLGELTEALA